MQWVVPRLITAHPIAEYLTFAILVNFNKHMEIFGLERVGLLTRARIYFQLFIPNILANGNAYGLNLARRLVHYTNHGRITINKRIGGVRRNKRGHKNSCHQGDILFHA